MTADAFEEAQANHQKAKGNSEPFDANHWLMNARKKAIRSKPYEVKEAAEVCADLARKAGWLAVEVREIKRE